MGVDVVSVATRCVATRCDHELEPCRVPVCWWLWLWLQAYVVAVPMAYACCALAGLVVSEWRA